MARPSPETIYARNVQLSQYHWTDWGGTDVDSTIWIDSKNAGYTVLNRTWQGSNTANYKDMIKQYSKSKLKRLLPFNYYYATQVIDWDRWGFVQNGTRFVPDPLTNGSKVAEVDNVHYSSSIAWRPAPPVDESYCSDAYTRARSKLADAMSSNVNLAQSLGERRQTALMLANSIERIRKGAHALRHGDIGSAVEAFASDGKHFRSGITPAARAAARTKDFSNLWLEMKYGWRPLLSDIYGAIDLLSQNLLVDSWYTNVSARATAYNQRSGKDSDGRVGTWVTKSRTRVRYSVNYRVGDELKRLAAQTGLSNPALLAWELLPYSFVVDWFIPVGNYLEGLTAFDGFVLHSGHESVVHESETFEDYFKSWNTGGADYWVVNRHGCRRRRKVIYERKAITDFPSMGAFPSFRSPIGNDPLDRFTTSFALLRQLFRR